MCKANKDIIGLGNISNEGRFGYLSEMTILLIFLGLKNELPEVWMSSLRWNSNSETQVVDD